MIKILITGDFCPIQRIEKLVLSGNNEKVYNDFLPYLQNNDINITNLECPLTNENNPLLKIGPNLNAKPETIDALVLGKFNLITLSNNHIMDHGVAGLASTIQLFEKNKIDYVGAGKNLDDASKIFYKKIKNKQIAFLNFSENEFSTADINHAGANPLNPVSNYYSIKSAREKSDYVIAIVHGGHEGYSLPSPRMVDTYRFFIDAGANFVVGHHSHCFSGYEKYKDGFIFYSLGNFVFDWPDERNLKWNYGYAVNLLIDENRLSFNLIPYKQCLENPGLFLLTDSEKKEFEVRLQKLNTTISDKDLLYKEWVSFSGQMKKSCLINFECFNSRLYKSLRYRKLIPGFLSRSKKLLLVNILRCEAHRDIAIESLKS
jgi:hypothetical protein